MREAKRDGLVDQDIDESRSVPPDFERWFWHLTVDGFAEWDRPEEQRETP